MMYALSFFLICFLAVVVSIFSAGEMAVTASSRVRLHQMHKQGDACAGVVLTLQAKTGQLISSILLANTWTIITFMTAVVTNIFTQILGT